MFSVGLLYSCLDFLKLISSTGIVSEEFKRYFKNYKYSTADRILELSFQCGWVNVNQGGEIQLTERGTDIATKEYKTALIFQLEDLILNLNPSWASLLPKGRTEAKNYMPQDVSQCFREAGLFDNANDELIEFWDTLALAYRNYTHRRMTEIGRAGEKLSMDYELQRTGRRPIWQSFESNLSGFDLLSVVDGESSEKLQIEVKTSSSSILYAKLHLSKHEWNTAQLSFCFIFHLWVVEDKPTLYVVSVEQMEPHIPIDRGSGDWESVEVPFSVLV